MVKKFVYGTPFETEAVVKEIPSSEGNPDYGTFSTENGFSFTTKLADDDMVFGLGEANREMEDEYEIEFYIAREYRRNGYCEEASRELINQLFGDGVSANGKNLFIDKLYVTTQTENEPTISLLRKLGFREVEDGPVMVVLGNIFEKEDNFFAHEVVKLVLTKEEFSDGN